MVIKRLMFHPSSALMLNGVGVLTVSSLLTFRGHITFRDHRWSYLILEKVIRYDIV